MSIYRVTAIRTECFVFEVQAASEEEARENFLTEGREIESYYDVPSASATRTDDSLHVTEVVTAPNPGDQR